MTTVTDDKVNRVTKMKETFSKKRRKARIHGGLLSSENSGPSDRSRETARQVDDFPS